MYKITSPAPGYSGVKAGVRFVDGVAETDSVRAVNYFRRHGYEIEAPSATGDDEDTAPGAATAESEPEAFDPAQHDVHAVVAHLGEAGSSEAERVLDAEAAGKNRKGIVDHREEILARAAEKNGEQQ